MGGLVAAAILIGCIFVGRVIGIVVDGSAPASVTAVTVEIVMIAALVGLGLMQTKT